jgi:hypothetical protein
VPRGSESSMGEIHGVDVEEIRVAVLEIRAAMLEAPAEPFRNAKSIFPAAWCERASIVVARVLSERKLGEWTFVTAGLPDDPAGHAWLELRDELGVCIVSIDVTLDQFQEWGAPYIGEGSSPAVRRFSVPRFAGPWSEWPGLRGDRSYDEYAESISAYVARSQGSRDGA